MKSYKNKLTIHPTRKPHTFFLKYKKDKTSSYARERQIYKKLAQN